MNSNSESSNKIDQLLDAWYLMRIISLTPPIISKIKPHVSFTFSLVSNLFRQFLYARDVAPITYFAIENKDEQYNYLFHESKRFDYSINSEIFTNLLFNLDKKKGVFLNAHWLTYLFDYQERADYIWANFPLFYSIANEMSENKGPEFLSPFLEKDRLRDPFTGQRLTHRFYQVHKLNEMLERTVKNLDEYDGSIVKYIDEVLKECSCVNEKNWIRLIAAALNILTYEKSDNNKSLFQYAEEKNFLINSKNEPWKIKVGGEKRLWSALRDYIFDPYFRRLFINSLSNNNPIKHYFKHLDENMVNSEMHLKQLELPGDLWNEEFFNYYFSKLKMNKPYYLRRLFVNNSRVSARRLYHWFQQQEAYKLRVNEECLYPVYLDATFILRRTDLDFLVKNGGQIKSTIEMKIEDLKTEEKIVRAYMVLRQELLPIFKRI